jgi:hypothetical protein
MPPIQSRIFVVGCPRSGTTLLQSRLGEHPEIVTCFETHFFWRLEPASPWRRRWEIADGRAAKRFREFLDRIERPALAGRTPRSVFLRRYVNAFVVILDELALAEGKTRWLGKAPDHVLVIGTIERYVAGARFIHVVREGADAVASLYEVSRQSPRNWGGHEWPIDECVAKWNQCIRATSRQAGKPDHFVVHYEELVADPARVLRDVCGFLRIEFVPSMVEPDAGVAAKVTRDDRPWIAGARGAIRRNEKSKFLALFNARQRGDILSKLTDASHLTTGPIRPPSAAGPGAAPAPVTAVPGLAVE